MTPFEILYVEDDPGDVVLTKKAMSNAKVKNNLYVAKDGVEALEMLRKTGAYANQPRPDLILLDLNMPRMDGRQFFEVIKSDADLQSIPVVVLTTSDAEPDILNSYKLQASCFITKPVDLAQFTHVIRSIEEFWLSLVKLPPKHG